MKTSMAVIYAGEAFPSDQTQAIFLAGPTPRDKNVLSWRPDAVRILQAQGYKGHVFVPERRDSKVMPNYNDQMQWEEDALNRADCILFWVPRDLVTMPALTTNVEFGWWFQTGKTVFGAPITAPQNRYLIHKAHEASVPVAETLAATIALAMQMVGEGSSRTGGECHVPLYIWNTPSFQNWYKAQKMAGNRLDGAKVEWTFRVGPDKKFVFFWILHVDVYIASEDRHKTNEVVVSRPDISTVLIYHPGKTLYETKVILVREFRSPASNSTGFVWEIAGGSSFKPGVDPYTLAAHEVDEEVGLTIDPANVKKHEARQMVATLSAHKAHLFSIEIDDDQLNWLQGQLGVAKGVVEDTERTYTEVQAIGEILQNDHVDWSMLGMILSVLTPLYNK